MSNNNDDLRYSSEAAATRSILYSGLNDINLFVEDTDREFEYETIFKRLLGADYCIRTIFPLGGKQNVKLRYSEFGAELDGIKNFYIVDGDFDRYIHPDEMIHDNCFIYLNTYNIENYYIDEQSCLTFAKGCLKKVDAEVQRIVDFPEWKRRIVIEAKNLFLCYCVVQIVHPEEETLKRSPYLFLDPDTGFERTNGEFQTYRNHVLSITPDASVRIQEIAERYENENGSDYFNLICGKFLLTSLGCYLRKKTSKRIDNDILKWNLINGFDISKLDYVKNRIMSIPQ